jgi:hypothetical protein
MSDGTRAQLIHIDVDRRLGHEWDEWDGKPLPNNGDYDSPPRLFFGWSALSMAILLGVVALGVECSLRMWRDWVPGFPRSSGGRSGS